MDDELDGYIERSVADIARKCGIRQDKVWKAMSRLSGLNIKE